MKRVIKQHKWFYITVTLIMTLVLGWALIGCGTAMEVLEEVVEATEVLLQGEDASLEEGLTEEESEESALEPEGSYTSMEDVALYLHLYGELPPNFITKSEATDLGWQASKGNLWEVTEKKSIGGDRFGNREGLLPAESGRQYYECDINYEGGYRGAERLVYSNDGLVYYTPDHYESFELLYGEE